MAYTFKHGDRPLEGYVIQRGVGRGGFGEVYYAISDGGKEVALKYLRDNPSVELRGVSHCLNLKSPHLVSVFDVRQNAQGEYFIVMEYVSGPSLRDLLIAEPKGLGAQKAAYFVRELGKGLAYLHERGIVHRDLKPGNIFYEDGYVKIGDYGLTKFIAVSRHSAQTASVGTVHYMAPEVGSGSYQRSIDIYALGVMLYEMLLGRVPFEGATMGEVLMKHLTAQPEVDELPAPFPTVIRKALAKDPNERYQTVDEMVEAIFDVDDIKQSVVGFNPVSLASAVRRSPAATGETGDLNVSPIPSPNPIPRPATYPPPPPPRDFGAGRVYSRISKLSDKVERKLAKLEGRKPRRAGTAAAPPALELVTRGQQVQRFILSGLMAVGLSLGVAILVGQQRGVGDAFSAFFLVAAMSLGAGLACRVQKWMGPHQQVGWARRVLIVGCCAPPMLLAAIPAFVANEQRIEWRTRRVPVTPPAAGPLAQAAEAAAERADGEPRLPTPPVALVDATQTKDPSARGKSKTSAKQTSVKPPTKLERYEARVDGTKEVWAILAALVIAAMLIDWSKRIEGGTEGELKVGQAIKAGVGAAILAAMASGIINKDAWDLMLMAAGVAAASSLVVQAFAWVRPLARHGAAGAVGGVLVGGGVPAGARGPAADARVPTGSSAYPWPPAPPLQPQRVAETAAPPDFGRGHGPPQARVVHPPLAIPVERPATAASAAFTEPLPPLRSGFARSFWSVVAFCLLAGSVAIFLALLTIRFHPDERIGALAGLTACVSLTGVALSKTTLRRRSGFWRETFRPFVIAACLTGITAAGSTLGMSRSLAQEEVWALTTAIAIAGLTLVTALFGGRRCPMAHRLERPKKSVASEPFILAGDSGPGREEERNVGVPVGRAQDDEAPR